MSEKMSVERAAGILDPRHRERYESLAAVEDACSMGRDALLLRIPRSPYPDGDKSILSCPNCGSVNICTIRTKPKTRSVGSAGRLFCGRTKTHDRKTEDSVQFADGLCYRRRARC